jgi:hypothetical protein
MLPFVSSLSAPPLFWQTRTRSSTRSSSAKEAYGAIGDLFETYRDTIHRLSSSEQKICRELAGSSQTIPILLKKATKDTKFIVKNVLLTHALRGVLRMIEVKCRERSPSVAFVSHDDRELLRTEVEAAHRNLQDFFIMPEKRLNVAINKALMIKSTGRRAVQECWDTMLKCCLNMRTILDESDALDESAALKVSSSLFTFWSFFPFCMPEYMTQEKQGVSAVHIFDKVLGPVCDDYYDQYEIGGTLIFDPIELNSTMKTAEVREPSHSLSNSMYEVFYVGEDGLVGVASDDNACIDVRKLFPEHSISHFMVVSVPGTQTVLAVTERGLCAALRESSFTATPVRIRLEVPVDGQPINAVRAYTLDDLIVLMYGHNDVTKGEQLWVRYSLINMRLEPVDDESALERLLDRIGGHDESESWRDHTVHENRLNYANLWSFDEKSGTFIERCWVICNAKHVFSLTFWVTGVWGTPDEFVAWRRSGNAVLVTPALHQDKRGDDPAVVDMIEWNVPAGSTSMALVPVSSDATD